MKKLIGIAISFLCFAGAGYPQATATDSLQSLLPHLQANEKVEVLHELILELWLDSPDEAKQYAKKAMSISAALEDTRLQSISLRLMGGVQIYQGEYDMSLIYTRKALELALALNDSVLISNCLNNIGFNYYNLGSYSEALDNFLRALNIRNKLQHDYATGNVLNNVGLVYLRLEDYNTARTYFNEALELGNKIKEQNTRIYASNNIGQTYLQQGYYSEAERYFKKSIKIANTINNNNWEATAYSGLGQVHLKRGAISDAWHNFKVALSLRNQIGDLKGISEVYYYFSKMHAHNSQLDSAFHYINISQSMAEKVQSKDRLLENFQLYKELYIKKEQYDSALIYQSMYVQLHEKQADENAVRSVAGIKSKIKEESTLRELAAKDIELAQKSFQANLSIALAIFILLISVVIYWFYKSQKQLSRNLSAKNLEISYQRDEISRKNEELNDLNIEKNNLISIVAHDLKSPLNNIRGLISIISLPSLPPENKATDYIQLINKSAVRLSEMIDKILNIEAIESKKLNLKMENVNFSKVVRNALQRFDLQATHKQIQFHPSITENVIVRADKGYIDQVIENLLSNAIKFSPKGKSIYINLIANNNKALFEIKDQGPGLSPEDKKKLFRKFQKLSAMPTANETSTGLGLSIVKKFVDAMKGDLWCESEAGKGASFFVTFKLSDKSCKALIALQEPFSLN